MMMKMTFCCIRVFKAFTPLSRDDFEAVWDIIAVQVILDRSFVRGLCCKATSTDTF